MKNKRAVLLLRLAFILGAVTAAAALLPLMSQQSATNFWGFEAFPDPYGFAAHFGAALMLGWALLLVWACCKPMERRMVAAITALVVLGMIVAEIIAIQGGVMALGRALASLIIQALILALYSFVFFASRTKNLLPDKAEKE